MFVHHVFFWLQNPSSEEDAAKLLGGLNSLKQIEVIKMAEIGRPAITNRAAIERSYHFSWLLTFDNLEDQNTYQIHPVHLKFVDTYSNLWSRVLIFDSETVTSS